MPFNVVPLVNTCHALGFSECLILDALISFRCHLRAIECIIHGWSQIGVVLGLGFIAKQRSSLGFDYILFALMRGNNPRTP